VHNALDFFAEGSTVKIPARILEVVMAEQQSEVVEEPEETLFERTTAYLEAYREGEGRVNEDPEIMMLF
jgi:predicted transcriptional regulator